MEMKGKWDDLASGFAAGAVLCIRDHNMTVVTIQLDFDTSFQCQGRSSKIWSDGTRTKYYLQFEACLAIVQACFGMIPVEAALQRPLM